MVYRKPQALSIANVQCSVNGDIHLFVAFSLVSFRMDPDYNDALTNLLSLQERLASSDSGMEFEGTGRGDENEPETKENISDLLFGDIGEPIAPSNRDVSYCL